MELLGVYFGSFDPLHENHMAVAKFAMEQGYCSAVVLVANGDNPLKPEIAACAQRQELIDTRLAQEERSGGAAGAEWADQHQQDWWDLQDWWWNSSRIAQYRCNWQELARMGWKERLWLCEKLSKQFGFSGGASSTIQLMGEDSFLQAAHSAGDSLKFARGRKLLIFPRTSSSEATTSGLQATLQGLSAAGHESAARKIFIASGYEDPLQGLSSTAIRAALTYEEENTPRGLHPAVYAKLRELRMYGTAPPTIPVLYFTGRPGSGKSTTAWRLAEDLQFGYFSSGDVFRSLVAASKGGKGGGRKGKKKAVTKEVATAHVLQQLEGFLVESRNSGRGVVLDCQPREDADSLGEREVLLRVGLQINLLVNLVCSAEIAAERISARGVRPGEDWTTGKGSQKRQQDGKAVPEQDHGRANWDFEVPVQRLIAEARQTCPRAVLELDVSSDAREAIYADLRHRADAALRDIIREKNQKGFLPPGSGSVQRLGESNAPSIHSAALGQEVSHHYDLAAQTYGDRKKNAGDASAKHFFYNNWVKSCLITLGLDAAARSRGSGLDGSRICVLDLGCGRGGDVGKWAVSFLDIISQEEHRGVPWSFHYLGLDLSAEAISAAQQRWSGLRKSALLQHRKNIHFDFRVADFTAFEEARRAIESWTQDQRLPSASCFRLISSQMALHYSFESYAKASNFVRMCQEYACSDAAGAVLLATTVDSEVVRSRCSCAKGAENGSGGWFGNTLYRIEFLPPPPVAAESCSSHRAFDCGQSRHEQGGFGQAYRFSLTGAIDNCREFLVDPAVLEELFEGGQGAEGTSVSRSGGLPHQAPRANVQAENFLEFGEQVLRAEADGCQGSPTFQFFSSSKAARLAGGFQNLAQDPKVRLLISGDSGAGPQGFDLDGDAREVCGLYRILLARFAGLRGAEAEGGAEGGAGGAAGSQAEEEEEARSKAVGPHHPVAVPSKVGEQSHPPKGRTFFKAQDYSHVIVRHPVTGKYLAVEETWNRGWFIPAGCLDPGETYRDAAVRETLEETGVEVELKGILGVHRGLTSSTGTRRNVAFYAEPTREWLDKHDKDGDVTKATADEHSLQARWMTCQEFAQLEHIRADDLVVWGEYIESGQQIYPLELLHECILVKQGGGIYRCEGDGQEAP